MNLSKVLIFVTGAALGSLVTWKVTKDMYKKIADEEIQSVKEVFSTKTDKKETEPKVDENTVKKYDDIIKHSGYAEPEKKKEEVGYMKDKPYVITPEEFDEIDEYDTVSLTYYADGVLVDDEGYYVEDVESMVGEESLNHFGEYEADSVFVRNDNTCTDYEILLDTRKYTDVHEVSSE